MLTEGKRYTWEEIEKGIDGLQKIRRYIDAHHFCVNSAERDEIHHFGDLCNGTYVYEGSRRIISTVVERFQKVEVI